MKKLTKREKILLGASIVGAGVAGYFAARGLAIVIHNLFYFLRGVFLCYKDFVLCY